MAVAPDPLYPHYKRARNQLRKFETGSVLKHLVDALYKAHHGGVEVLRYYQPWNILLAMKWAIQEMDGVSHRRATASLRDVHKVLNILHEMEGDALLPSDYEHIMLFMRRMAFQQFWLHHADGSALARQEVLFGELPADHPFQRQFLAETGIAARDFLDLSFALFSLALADKPPRAVSRSDFAVIEHSLKPGYLDNFLKHISRTPQELHGWFTQEAVRDVSVSDQLVLPNPLLKAPLLHANGLYLMYYPPLVYRSLEESVYRTLRSADPAAFMQRFGRLFEGYVNRCLTAANLTYSTESEIQRQLPGAGKCVDFLIVENGCNILIDAKGIEMSPLGRVSIKAETIYHAIKESAVKAIIQGMETVRRIDSAPTETRRGRNEHFLLVVTFEQLYLGSSDSLAATLGTSLTDKLKREFGETLPFPLENVFFLSIGEFERMLGRVRAQKATVLQFARHAKREDAEPKTRKFNFGQHVDSLCGPEDRLPFIEVAFRRIVDRCITKLPPDLRRGKPVDGPG